MLCGSVAPRLAKKKIHFDISLIVFNSTSYFVDMANKAIKFSDIIKSRDDWNTSGEFNVWIEELELVAVFWVSHFCSLPSAGWHNKKKDYYYY